MYYLELFYKNQEEESINIQRVKPFLQCGMPLWPGYVQTSLLIKSIKTMKCMRQPRGGGQGVQPHLKSQEYRVS